LGSSVAATMLTPGIHNAYQEGVQRLAGHPKVREVARGQVCNGPHQCQAALFVTDATDFLADPSLGKKFSAPPRW
jgi:alpha-ketoglutaric semialdehyde dehydrogenase